MENKPHYSVLCIMSEGIENVPRIIDYLLSGIKVTIICSEKINLDNNEILKKARDIKLLQIVICDELFLLEYEEYIDGTLPSYLEELLKETDFNIEQFKIEHSDITNNIIVKAGAGSGKTKTMIDRIMYIKHMDSNISFSDISMITFTNKATNEMKARLSNRISEYYSLTKNQKYLSWMQELNLLSINTIHSFAKTLIADNSQGLGLSPNFIVSNFRYKKKKILEQLIHKYNEEYRKNYLEIKHIPQYLVIDVILKILEDFDNKAVDISDKTLIEIGNEPFSHMLNYLLRNLVKELEVIKIDEDRLETSDLIKKLRQLINMDNIKINCKYLFVDEFQDTDMAQAEFFNYLVEKYSIKVFIVGDTKQSIYRFRGADYTAFETCIHNIRNMNCDFEEYSLNINYRSNKELLEKFNSLFYNLNSHVDKFNFTKEDYLTSFKPKNSEVPITITDMSSSLNFINSVKDTLREKAARESEGQDKVSIAILARSNRQVREAAEILNSYNIYCNVDIEGDFFRHRAVIEFYSLIKGLLYRKDSLSLYGLLNSSYGNLIINNNDILREYSTEKDVIKEYLKENTEALNLLNMYHDIIINKPVLEAISEIILIAKPHCIYGKKKYRSLENKNDIELLKNIKLSILDYEMNLDYLIYLINKRFGDKQVTLFDIEEYLKVNISSNKEESRKKLNDSVNMDAISCMTVHKAKGLEFDIVIMPYTSSSFFHKNSDVDLFINEIGSDKYQVGYSIEIAKNSYRNELYSKLKPIEKQELLGEETRLLYVALTRAKDRLIIHSPSLVASTIEPSSWMNLIDKGGLK